MWKLQDENAPEADAPKEGEEETKEETTEETEEETTEPENKEAQKLGELLPIDFVANRFWSFSSLIAKDDSKLF